MYRLNYIGNHRRPVIFFHTLHPTTVYTLSLHDALPISRLAPCPRTTRPARASSRWRPRSSTRDRKSTRLNSHSDLVCRLLLEKKKKTKRLIPTGTFVTYLHTFQTRRVPASQVLSVRLLI